MSGAWWLAVAVVGLLGCSSDDPTLQDVLSDAEADAAATQTDGTEGAPGSSTDDAGDDPDADESEVGDDAGIDDAGADAGSGIDVVDEDPFAVPEVIDEAYVSLVINELLAIVSESLRAVLADEDPGGVQAERVHREVYGAPQLDERLESLEASFVDDRGRQTQLSPDEFGVQRFELLELESGDRRCFTAFGHYDLRETARSPLDPDLVVAFVVSRDESVDRSLNPVGWRLWDNTALVSGGVPVSVGELDEVEGLSEIIDTDCGPMGADE